MADDLVAMGGGAWAREDCEAALEGSGGNMEVAMDLLMGGFTKAGAAAQSAAAGGSGGGAGGGPPAAGDGVFTAEDLGNGLWKIVEADRHGQYPFTYAIMAGAAPTRCVLIDTGCGTSDYKAFLDVSLHDIAAVRILLKMTAISFRTGPCQQVRPAVLRHLHARAL